VGRRAGEGRMRDGPKVIREEGEEGGGNGGMHRTKVWSRGVGRGG